MKAAMCSIDKLSFDCSGSINYDLYILTSAYCTKNNRRLDSINLGDVSGRLQLPLFIQFKMLFSFKLVEMIGESSAPKTELFIKVMGKKC